MLVIKEGGHRLFESDPETSRVVADLLADLKLRGLAAVRDLSRRFDGWDPPSFELSEGQITESINACSPRPSCARSSHSKSRPNQGSGWATATSPSNAWVATSRAVATRCSAPPR